MGRPPVCAGGDQFQVIVVPLADPERLGLPGAPYGLTVSLGISPEGVQPPASQADTATVYDVPLLSPPMVSEYPVFPATGRGAAGSIGVEGVTITVKLCTVWPPEHVEPTGLHCHATLICPDPSGETVKSDTTPAPDDPPAPDPAAP